MRQALPSGSALPLGTGGPTPTLLPVRALDRPMQPVGPGTLLYDDRLAEVSRILQTMVRDSIEA
jgi:hypothetical protein